MGISTARKEYEALVAKGRMIVDVLQEDDTPLYVLSTADRRAVRAYFNAANGSPGRCHSGEHPEDRSMKNRRKKRRQDEKATHNE